MAAFKNREKARKAVVDALNGEYDTVDPALRRALIALATEHDEQAVKMEEDHSNILSTVKRTQGLLIVSIASVFGTVVAAIVVNAVV